MRQKLIKKNSKSKTIIKKPKSNKVKLFIFFYVTSFLMLLSGLVTFFTTYGNHQYYQCLVHNYYVEVDSVKVNQVNQEFDDLLVELKLEKENFNSPTSTTDISFNSYLDNYWSNLKIYDSSVSETYARQDFLTFFMNSYLNGDNSTELSISQLKKYKNLYSYTDTYYLLMNNQNEKYPSNDGYTTSIFLMILAVLVLLINSFLIWKVLFRKTKKITKSTKTKIEDEGLE